MDGTQVNVALRMFGKAERGPWNSISKKLFALVTPLLGQIIVALNATIEFSSGLEVGD
jgi:hypothetical protein